MNGIFKDYSKYYDLLYSSKDYKAEVSYVDDLIKKYSSQPSKSVLDLGCGTGKHDFFLSEKGYEITGVDISTDMLKVAQRSKLNNVTFQQGDIRSLELHKLFDVVLSLFHVINYQTSDRDLYETFHTVSTHLRPGGIFIFDFWYGPAVLSNKPAEKRKEIEDEELKITRTSKSVMYPEKDIVDVTVEVEIINKLSGEKINLSESHKMRYLFLSKLQKLLSEFSIEIIKEEEWLTGKPLGRDSWNACIIARAM